MDTAALTHQGGAHTVKLKAQVHERGQAGTISKSTWRKDAGERQKRWFFIAAPLGGARASWCPAMPA